VTIRTARATGQVVAHEDRARAAEVAVLRPGLAGAVFAALPDGSQWTGA